MKWGGSAPTGAARSQHSWLGLLESSTPLELSSGFAGPRANVARKPSERRERPALEGDFSLSQRGDIGGVIGGAEHGAAGHQNGGAGRCQGNGIVGADAAIHFDLDRAIAEYETLIRASPGNPQFVFEECEALLQRGDRARAMKLVTELEDFGDDPEKSSESILESIQMAWYEEVK